MNNYIVDPSVFYWINVLAILQTVLAIFGGLLIACGIGTLIGYFYNVTDLESWAPETREKYIVRGKACKKSTIILLCFGIAMVVLSIFIPGKSTSIEMMVARTATFDNVDWTVQQVKEVIDYIVSALKGVV